MRRKKNYKRNGFGGLGGWIVFLFALVLFSFVQPIEPKYRMEQTIQEWNIHISGFEYVRQRLAASDLPARDVKFMSDSILGKFETELIKQITPQLPKDTIGKKK